MFTKWSKEVAKENFKLYKENYEKGASWRREASMYEDARYGTIFSRAEEAEMVKFRQSPVPISIMSAIMDTAEAMMLSNKPISRVAPIINPFNEQLTNASKQVAAIYDHFVKKSWYESLGDLQTDRVIRDSGTVGHGLYYIVPRMDYGEFKVSVDYLEWRDYFPHFMTKDPFYRDSDCNIIAKVVSKKTAYQIAKSIDASLTQQEFDEEIAKGTYGAINSRAGHVPSGGLRGDSDVLFTQRFVLEEHVVYQISPTYNAKRMEDSYKFVTEITADIENMAREGLVDIRPMEKFYLTEYTAIGAYGVRRVLGVTKHNIVSFVHDHRNNPYPIGRAAPLYPIQRAFNKMIMIALLNGSLSNGTRILAEENSIVNENHWQTNFATSGAILKYRLPIPGQSKPPEIVKAEPLSQAWLALPQWLIGQMEYISGIFSYMMGNPQGTPDVFGVVASLQSSGSMKIKRRLGHLDATLSVVGEVVADFYKEYAPLNGFSNTIQPDGTVDEPVMYNRLMPDPNDKTKLMIDPSTDLSIGYRSIRFTSQSSNGYEAGTEAALLTTLATQLGVKELVPLILKRLNMPEVDKLISNMDVASQSQQQIAQMAEVIKALEKRTEQLTNLVHQKGFEVSKASFDAKLTKILEKVKNSPELGLELLNAEGSTE